MDYPDRNLRGAVNACAVPKAEQLQLSSNPWQEPARDPDRSPRGIELELWRRCKDDGDEDARGVLITRYLPIARSQARRYSSTGMPFEDLLQVASLGLIKAVDRFEPRRGVAFSTFAVPVIQGELKRSLGETGWAVHMPRRLQQLVQRVRRSDESLTARQGRTPTATELADNSGLSLEEVQEAMTAELAWVSHTEYLGRRATARRRSSVEEGLDGSFELIDEASSIARALATLSDRERRVLRLSFIEERAQHEIAGEIGISQRQVSRIIRQALARMQEVANRPSAFGSGGISD
jgi:RNA polymerase sigma-B factor